MELSIEDKLILAAAKLNPSDSEIKPVDELIGFVNDWEYFTEAVIRNGLGPLVYKNFSYAENYDRIPRETISRLKQTYIIAFERNGMLYHRYNKISKAFADEGISVIPLKGIFLAEAVYKDIGLRPMSDIDILVKEDDASKCFSILQENGYTSRERVKSKFIGRYAQNKHLPSLVSENVSVEIHIDAHTDGCTYHVNMDDFWKNAVTKNTGKKSMLALSPNNLLQYLCLHLEHHFYSGMIMLYQYCDIAEVLKLYKNELDWNSFKISCEIYHCSKNVYRHLFIAHRYFNAPLPEEILQNEKYYYNKNTEELFLDYFKGNEKEISKKIMHTTIRNIRMIRGTGKKLLFLLHDIFPSVSFMNKRYHIHNKILIPGYYLLRIKTGLVILFRSLVKK